MKRGNKEEISEERRQGEVRKINPAGYTPTPFKVSLRPKSASEIKEEKRNRLGYRASIITGIKRI